jgi:hypothetical protein
MAIGADLGGVYRDPVKQTLKIGEGKPGPGRPKGVPNKSNALVKDAIIQAAMAAHPEGMTGYLTDQALENPVAFMTLLGKVLPTQIEGGDNPLMVAVTKIALVAPQVNED